MPNTRPSIRAAHVGKPIFIKDIALVRGLRNLSQGTTTVGAEVNEMFRAELNRSADESLLQIEGRLVGDWAGKVKSLLSWGPVPKGLIVDLTEVSYVDSVGEQVLTWLSSLGARFVAKAVYAATTCKRLNLVLHTKPVLKKSGFCGVLVAQEGTD